MGLKGRPNGSTYEPVLDVAEIEPFVREYNRHRGNFADHIATSIPTIQSLVRKSSSSGMESQFALGRSRFLGPPGLWDRMACPLSSITA